MRAHLFQLDLAWEDKPANYALVREAAAGAAIAPGDLIVLPEMFDTGFSFHLEATADSDGRTLAFLQDLARGLRATVHGSRTLLGPDGRGRNMATIIAPDGKIACEYAKIHPFSYGREPERFTGGDEVRLYGWAAHNGERLTICPAVCYDLRFPELFRRGLKAGAQAYAIGANWPVARAAHWRALLIARAIENQAVVLGVNRCGKDPHLAYGGGSMAVGPKGDPLGELGAEPGVLSVEMEAAAVLAWREEFPAWRDARLA
jgi:predicted amidohydrolase